DFTPVDVLESFVDRRHRAMRVADPAAGLEETAEPDDVLGAEGAATKVVDVEELRLAHERDIETLVRDEHIPGGAALLAFRPEVSEVHRKSLILRPSWRGAD